MTTLIYRWENCGAVANGKAGNQTAVFLTTAQHCLPGLLCLGLSSLLFGAPDLEVREKSWLLHPFLGDSVQWFFGTEIGVALLRTSGLKQSFAAWYILREMHCKPWLIPSCLSLAPGSVFGAMDAISLRWIYRHSVFGHAGQGAFPWRNFFTPFWPFLFFICKGSISQLPQSLLLK